MATVEDFEARVAALEATQADYRAVLAAVNALGANQREQALGLVDVKADLVDVKSEMGQLKIEMADFRRETNARFRSVDEQLADIKDLIVGGRDR